MSVKDNPTTLAYPLKRDGVIVSDGYGLYEYPDPKLILEIWQDRADIVPLTKKALYASTAPDIIAGLAEDAGRHPNSSPGRTFVGIDDRDHDKRYETILIFNSKAATAPRAADVLRGFGADKVMMLDGGDSTQLICRGRPYLQSESSRAVPQMLAVTGGLPFAPPPLSECYITHTVQPGETLASIACYYAATIDELARTNDISNPNLIFPGQALCLP